MDNIKKIIIGKQGSMLKEVGQRTSGATVFGYTVKDPERFGIMELDEAVEKVNYIRKYVSQSLLLMSMV